MMPGVSPVAGMNCLAFMLDPELMESMDLDALALEIEGLAESSLNKSPLDGKTLEIPVCYDAQFAPDLDRVAEHCGLTPKEVIRLHTSGRFTAQLIGFLPGFAYMGGLDAALNVPRLESPRPKVPAGALGITGTQCAIYPTASPGGWNLIGRCPLVLFDTAKESPCLIQLGDTVRFFSISVDEFERLWAAR
jgi:inhibitor of KinA